MVFLKRALYLIREIVSQCDDESSWPMLERVRTNRRGLLRSRMSAFGGPSGS